MLGLFIDLGFCQRLKLSSLGSILVCDDLLRGESPKGLLPSKSFFCLGAHTPVFFTGSQDPLPAQNPLPGTHVGTSWCLASHLLEHCLSSKNVPLRAHICRYSLSRRLSSSQIKWVLPALWERADSHPETSGHWSLSHLEENPASQACVQSHFSRVRLFVTL